MATVIYSEADGVFIGACLGLAFWSNLDPVGQECAAAFKSDREANEFMKGWEGGIPPGIRLVAVEADRGDHASIAACVRAGLPGWDPEETQIEQAAAGVAP